MLNISDLYFFKQEDTCVRKKDATGLITLKEKIGDITPKPILGALNVKNRVIQMKTVVELNVIRDIALGGGWENVVLQENTMQIITHVENVFDLLIMQFRIINVYTQGL